MPQKFLQTSSIFTLLCLSFSSFSVKAMELQEVHNDIIISNVPRYAVALAQEEEGQHGLANYNYNLAIKEEQNETTKESNGQESNKLEEIFSPDDYFLNKMNMNLNKTKEVGGNLKEKFDNLLKENPLLASILKPILDDPINQLQEQLDVFQKDLGLRIETLAREQKRNDPQKLAACDSKIRETLNYIRSMKQEGMTYADLYTKLRARYQRKAWPETGREIPLFYDPSNFQNLTMYDLWVSQKFDSLQAQLLKAHETLEKLTPSKAGKYSYRIGGGSFSPELYLELLKEELGLYIEYYETLKGEPHLLRSAFNQL